ncbi:hypothetical protein BC941DRAFT_86103 [Chlamydoabsidia padenii]|nr:hypothetical protein BC941DRAFT_86103 [Chlamydoabsidia padenii]
MSLDIQPEEPTGISKAQEEEMSSALIAKLLAQDAMNEGDYYGEYYDYNDDSDDYAPKYYGKPKKTKVKKKKEPQQRGRKRKTVDIDIPSGPATIKPISHNTESPKIEMPTKVKKVKKPLPPGYNTGAYTANEEVLFLEGLDLHGRNWNDLSRHMGTRDPHSIRSHAQKHFIKLFRDNLPLPDKVKESGEGYTLSGKPLDPDSAAAKPYLNRSGMVNKTPNLTQTMQVSQSKISNASMENSDMEQTTGELNIGNLTLASTEHDHLTDKQSPHPCPPLTVNVDTCKGDTNHASLELRQSQKYTESPISNMMECEPVSDKPGSDTRGQPIELTICSNVLLTLELHAHLVNTGMIGFLAGEWNKTTKRILVKEAYPCQSLSSSHIKMDPKNAMEIRHMIENKHLVPVGWYHQASTTAPDTEARYNYHLMCGNDSDANNNLNQKENMIDSPTFKAMDHFIGAIVKSPANATSPTTVNWIYYGTDWDKEETPKQLVYDVQEDTCLSPEEETRLLLLPNQYKSSPGKVGNDSQKTTLDNLIKRLAPWIQKKVIQQDNAQNTFSDNSMEEQLSADDQMDTFLKKLKTVLMDW